MDLTIKLLLWVHLLSVALSGATAFAMPLMRRLAVRAAPEHKAAFPAIMNSLAALGRMALVLLILSGLAMIWAKYGGFSALDGWFHLKMLLVVVLSGLAIFNIYNARWAAAGDSAAVARRIHVSRAVTALIMAIIFTAVFAFN